MHYAFYTNAIIVNFHLCHTHTHNHTLSTHADRFYWARACAWPRAQCSGIVLIQRPQLRFVTIPQCIVEFVHSFRIQSHKYTHTHTETYSIGVSGSVLSVCSYKEYSHIWLDSQLKARYKIFVFRALNIILYSYVMYLLAFYYKRRTQSVRSFQELHIPIQAINRIPGLSFSIHIRACILITSLRLHSLHNLFHPQYDAIQVLCVYKRRE